jgi:hypothetical protein
VFVYDSDGSTTGTLWYLYFRTQEVQPHEQARERALRHGLKERDAVNTNALWNAGQRLLNP